MTKARKRTSKPHHSIVAIEVQGGFLDGARLELADGLNCIIGGRGSGKTTVLELVRYALGLMPERETNPARLKAIEGLVKGNLRDGRIRLHVKTKHGVGYTAERPWNESCQVTDEKGVPRPISLERDMIFGADVYSLNEIEDIATTPALQRLLLDKFADEDVRRLNDEIARLLQELGENALELARLDREMRVLEETASQGPGLEEKLKALEDTGGPDAKKIGVAQAHKALREKERTTLENLRRDLKRAASELEPCLASNAQRLSSHLDDQLLEGPNKKVFTSLASEVRELSQLLEKTAAKLRERTEQVGAGLDEKRQTLDELHAKQEAEYRKLVVETEEERERTQERARLQTRYVQVTATKKELELREKQRSGFLKKRGEMLARLSDARDERYRLRKKVAERLTNTVGPTVRVRIDQAANRDEYRATLTEVLREGGLPRPGPVADRLASLTPFELSGLVASGDSASIVKRADVEAERAKRVVELLRENGRIHRVETVALEDEPRIELEDGRYKSSNELSTGQRCTTILPILLLEGDRPLLIDQPEENLDNAFIFQTIVKVLQEVKQNRQLLFVTHNPNIPVLGDAERVFVLSSNGQQATLVDSGTVDEVKDHVERILEGGAEAFRLRRERYGH